MDNPSSARPSAEKPSSSSGSQSSTTKPPVTQPEDEAGLMTDRSPLMTSYLHSRNSATSAEESAYLSKALWLRWTRFVLVVLTIATGTAAVGCAGHVLKRYNETNLGSEWHLTLWPSTVDVRPTLAILVAAVLATTLSVLYLVISLVPTVSSRSVHSISRVSRSNAPSALLPHALVQLRLRCHFSHRPGSLPYRHSVQPRPRQSLDSSLPGLYSVLDLQILPGSLPVYV